jgi:hypothetical protein
MASKRRLQEQETGQVLILDTDADEEDISSSLSGCDSERDIVRTDSTQWTDFTKT